MAAQPWRTGLKGQGRKNETHALRLHALSALSPDCTLRGLLLRFWAELEKSTLARLMQATQMLAGNDRRWAVATLRRVHDLRRRGAEARSPEAAARFYAQRYAYLEHAAHRLEKLHRTRIQ